MSVKEKAKAFEDRQSVVSESPPPKKKSREELIGIKDDGETLGKRSTAGPPVPPPRKYKKNGTIKSPGETSPCTDRKENVKPELITPKTTSDPDVPTSKKPPRPPPPPRGSSLGRKNTLLANIQALPSADKKTKPPVPPKPKNYFPKKVSAPGIASVKSDTSKVSQPTKSRADSAPVISTTADNHESQFFVNLGKDNVAPPESKESRTLSQFYVTHGKENAASPESLDSETSSQFFVSLEGKPSKEFERTDKTNYNISNGTTERNKALKTGKRITSGRDLPDPLTGLEITADVFSDEEGDFSEAVHKDEKENNLTESVDVINGITESGSTDVVMNEPPCDGLKTEDSLIEPKESVKIVYSVELEEECSITMIEDTSKRHEPEDNLPDTRTQLVFELKEEESEEILSESESENKMDKSDDLHEDMPDEKSVEQREVSESSNSECLPVATIEEQEKELIAENDDVNYLDQKEKKGSEFDVEKQTEDEEMCDIDVLDNLSDNDDEKISDNEEFYRTTMDVELKDDSQLQDVDSRQNEQKNLKEERVQEVVMQPVESQVENSDVIIAEAIREGTLISVTDRAVSEQTAEALEDENPEVEAEFDSEDVDDKQGPAKETSEITVSVSEDKLETHANIEISINDLNDEIEVQCSDAIVKSEPDLAASEELKSQDVDMTETVEEEKIVEHLLEEKVSESIKAEDSVELSCSVEDVVHLEADKDKVELSEVEPALETSEDVHVVECTVEERGKDDEEIASVEHVVAESEVNKETLNEVHVVECTVEEKQQENDITPVEHISAESQVNEDTEEPDSPTSPPPIKPERRSRRGQKHAYENIDPTKNRLNELKSGTSVRKVQSFSKYESVVHSLPRPVQRVCDDEAIYRVPSKVIPVESYATDESEYSVPYPFSSRKFVDDNEYAVPRPIVVQACAVTDRKEEDDGEIYSVPGQVTSVPVLEKIATPTKSEPVQVTPQDQEDDNIYAVPLQDQQKTVNAAPVTTEEVLPKKVTTVTVSAKAPPKPPRLSLTKEDLKITIDLSDTASSSSVDTVATVAQWESPKPVPRTREQRSPPSPFPRKSSKTESSESPTPPGAGSPVPAPRSRLNALQVSRETAPSNFSSSEISTLSSSEISTQESTEDEVTLKRKPPPRPPPPSGRTSMSHNEENMLPPVSPGPFANDDSDSDSDVAEEPSPKGPPKPKTYHIAHEILTTERTFVDALKLVREECYGTIKSANVVPESVLGDIFRDLENIYLLDSKFLQELEERMATWEEHERIGDIIKKYGHFLKMYTQYVNGYDKAMSVFQDTMKENAEFANLVSEFQASDRCHGMILSAYMLKPVQRIPSYRLLLIDYLKHLPKDSDESKDTEITLKIVSEVATHINESMKKMDSFEQMIKLQRMLVGQPEIIKAGRDYLKEGTLMKLCRKDMQERMFFLLTDVLLYTTPVGGNQYKLNKMLPLLGMQVTVPDSPDFVNEFSIISTTRSFTLTASTPEERDQWVEALNNAIDVVTKRKITFVNKTKDAAGMGIQEQDADFKLGEKAPVWIPDARVTMCMSCTSPFTLTNRRHHCRACGNVVCGSCSDSTAPLAYLDYNQARVCDKCYDMLLKDFHTDEIHVPEEEVTVLAPLPQEVEIADKLLRKPTKFEMMRRFKSRKTKRKSQIMHPAHLTEVVANQEGSQMSGYLRCKKGKHGWKKSWFVLKDNVLYSYKASSDVVALETLPVLGYEIEDLGKEGDDFVFHLKHKGVPPLIFKADNETSGTRWVRELKKAITMES